MKRFSETYNVLPKRTATFRRHYERLPSHDKNTYFDKLTTRDDFYSRPAQSTCLLYLIDLDI